MGKKTYRAWTWPKYRIGNGPIQFVDGMYTTEDPEEQALIEGAHGYGSRIIDVTEPAPDEIPYQEAPAVMGDRRGKWRAR